MAFKNPSDKKKTKKTLFIVIGAAIAMCGIAAFVFLFMVFRKDPDITSEKIMEKLKTEIASITDATNYSEINDPNGIMGKPNQYISKSSWQDSDLKEHASEYAGTIEVFNNTKDAELRELKIKTITEECVNTISQVKYGPLADMSSTCKDYTLIRNGAVFIRLSSAFSDEQIGRYKNALDKIIERFVMPDKEIPTQERIDEMKQEISSESKEFADGWKENFEKNLDETLNSYIARLDAAAISLKEDELATIKQELQGIEEVPYYAPRLIEVEAKIKSIEDTIAAKKAKAAEDAAKAEAARLAAKNRRLSAGKYTACIDIDAGTYDATAISGGGNFIVDSDSYAHYVNEILYANGSYGQKEYKNMTLSCNDVLNITSSLVVQLTAKR